MGWSLALGFHKNVMGRDRAFRINSSLCPGWDSLPGSGYCLVLGVCLVLGIYLVLSARLRVG